MSRHHAQTQLDGQRVMVVAGYDRPTQEVFLQVFADDGAEEGEDALLYSSLYEPHLDWSDAETVAGALNGLGLIVPPSLLEAIRRDLAGNIGNRVVTHHFDRDPEVLLAG